MTYTSLRRKPWYPRRKQPRHAAKLGAVHRVILREVYTWEWCLTTWLKDHRVSALEYEAVKAQVAVGMDWQPCTMRTCPAQPWSRALAATVSRALRGLVQRGMVETVPFAGSRRTRAVRLTDRGRAVAKRLVGKLADTGLTTEETRQARRTLAKALTSLRRS
jgi:hypothetical protein